MASWAGGDKCSGGAALPPQATPTRFRGQELRLMPSSHAAAHTWLRMRAASAALSWGRKRP